MPMLEPKELEQRRHKRVKSQRRKKRSLGALPLILSILVVYALAVAIMPPPALKADIIPINFAAKPAGELAWPAYGQAAIGAVGFGMLGQSGDQKPLPIASVAKVVTAVAVLKQHPITSNQPMPVLKITAEDVATYRAYLAQDQSVVEVKDGEELTEYQALQALLLPSANNIADILARWAFGSTEDYLQFVNPFTKTLGMTNTNIADASGFSPNTTSTAEDLAKLAEIAMNNPTIAEIVNQAQADLPVAGTVYNVNKLVGHDGIVGIKTGNTDEAGGCYMFAVRRNIDAQRTATLFGVVMGADNLSMAIDDSVPLIDSAFKQFRVLDAVHTGQLVGKITQAGQEKAAIVTKDNLSIITWGNIAPTAQITTNNLGRSIAQGADIGRMDISVGNMVYSLPIMSESSISSPGYAWRFRHEGGYL